MGVRETASLFEARQDDRTTNGILTRSQSECAVHISVNGPDLPLILLDPSPLEDAPPTKRAPPAIKPKPPKLSRKPSLPARPRSSGAVITSSAVTKAPHRINLIDLEESDREDSASSIQESESLSPSVSKTSPKSPKNFLEDARKRTALISSSVLKDVRNITDVGLRKSNEAANAVKQSALPITGKIGEGFTQMKSNATQVLDNTGVSKAVGSAVDGTKKTVTTAGAGAQALLEKTGIPESFNRTKEDFADLQARFARKEGLCSKCRTLPLHLASPSALDCPSPEVFWATPLSRVIYHSTWCRVCSLLLSMLCRPEHDPILTNDDVAQHVPEELKGMSMQEWVGNGWSFTEQNWPFGQGEVRHEGATYVLGQMGDVVTETSKDVVRYGIAVGSYIAIGASFASASRRRYVYRRPSRWKAFSEGLRRAQENDTKYPLSCVVQISMRTHVDLESPGLLFVDLIGYGRAPQATAKPLSQFKLRAVQRGTAPRSLSLGPLSYGHLLNREWIDLSTFKTCLEACEKYHGAGCREHAWSEAMQKPSFLRVIDCEKMCITEVSNPSTCRFIALSYVWGNSKTLKLRFSNISQLTNPGGLIKYLHGIPKTIINAIDAVRGIGERYLWVDALCILQEKTQETLEQIATMDRIYGSAILTIVASDGDDADYGLRGVPSSSDDSDNNLLISNSNSSSATARQLTQPTAEFRDEMSIIGPFNNPQNLDESIWNLRAWTFQERLLSRRFLVFGNNEAVWYCRAMTGREDMLVQDSGYGEPLKGWLSLERQHLVPAENWRDGSIEVDRYSHTRVVRSGTFHEYAKMVEQYSHRQMTYDRDVVNALTGLLNIFDACFKSTMIFALPEVLFDIALLWTPTEQLSRRHIREGGDVFPSWSWTGWKGRVTYNKPYTFRRGSSTRSPIRFNHADDGEEGFRPFIRWHLWSNSTSRLRKINGNGIGLPLHHDELPREWENSPYQSPFSSGHRSNFSIDINQLSAAAHRLPSGDHHLVFWTSCSTAFSFGDGKTQPSDQRWTKSQAPLRYSIADRDFEWAGTILLDGNGPEWIDSDRHEWILLGEAQFYGLDDEPRDVEGYDLYLIMLIEWDHSTKTATRLGLGRIKKAAWKIAEPEMKLVILG